MWTVPDGVHYAPPQEIVGPTVLVQPRLVAVSFASDPDAKAQRDFVAFLCHSAWWKSWAVGTCSTTDPASCVGLCASATAVTLEMPAAPLYSTAAANALGLDPTPTLDGLLIDAFAAHQLPSPVANDLFVVNLPPSSALWLQGDAKCQAGAGAYANYRGYVQIARADHTQVDVPYVISSHCAAGLSPSDPSGYPDYQQLALSQLIAFATQWPVDLGAENHSNVSAATGTAESLCRDYAFNNWTVKESGYSLLRIWSNGASADGHAPCMPETEGAPYIQMRAPIPSELLAFTAHSADRVVHIPLLAVSDQPVPEGWLVSGSELLSGSGFPSAVLRFDGEPSKVVHAGEVVVLEVALENNPTTTATATGYPRRLMVYSTRLTAKRTNTLYVNFEL